MALKDYQNRRIKDVLSEKPELAEVLKKYDINCHTCTGNCVTKDVTEEHNLSMKEEMDFADKVGEVLAGKPKKEKEASKPVPEKVS